MGVGDLRHRDLGIPGVIYENSSCFCSLKTSVLSYVFIGKDQYNKSILESDFLSLTFPVAVSVGLAGGLLPEII